MKFLPQKYYVKHYYEYYSGKKLDYANPVEFNQKISWYKVFYQPKILNQLVDKYAVREYVKTTIGDEFLNECYGVYSSFKEIPLDSLPQKFVLKGTHGCNYNLIVTDKSTLNKKRTKKIINKWLSRNYYYKSGLEWAYKDVPPRIIAEAFLEPDEPNSQLKDYKFFCFSGVPNFVQIDEIISGQQYRCFYDLNWKKQEFFKGNSKVLFLDKQVNKPVNFEEMIQLSIKMSHSFPFVRVDFYSVKGKTIFGEMTFYPSDARTEFKPSKFNKIFGDLIELPKKQISNA